MYRTNPVACDYALASEDAEYFKAVCVLPFAYRRELLARFEAENGTPALIEVFAQFMGMANSVVANNREMAEMLLISVGHCDERTAESANLPTIFGALHGVVLANRARSQGGMCEGCAYRLATPANQSPITSLDAADALEECSARFMCHVRGLDDEGEPTRLCAGFAQLSTR
jgi:cation transport regulator ChaC